MNDILKPSEETLEELEKTKWKRAFKTIVKDWRLYALLIPLLVFMFLFKYRPIVYVIQGFKEYNIAKSMMDCDWQGITHLKKMFNMDNPSYGPQFWRALRNTFVNSMYGLVFGFPIPIILALLFSEIKNSTLRSIYQVLCYLPKFLSVVVTAGIVITWCKLSTDNVKGAGFLTELFADGGLIYNNKQSILETARFFRPIYQITGIWEGAGYGSIVYFAAVMAISPTNYEAAKIDGASKLQQIRYVTFPGMAPTLSIMLILRIGHVLNIGYDKVILLYTRQSYETADVVSSFVYRRIQSSSSGVAADESFGVVADLFNSVLAMFLVLGANAISRRISDTSLF